MPIPQRLRSQPALRPAFTSARRWRDRGRRLTAPQGRARRGLARVALLVVALPARLTRSTRQGELRAALAVRRARPVPDDPGVVTIRTGNPATATELATADQAGAAFVCLLAPTAAPLTPDVAPRLATAVRAHPGAVAATPLVVRPAPASILQATPNDVRVDALGYDVVLDHDAPRLAARRNHARVPPIAPPEPVPVAAPACLVVATAALHDVGGFDPKIEPARAVVDLCLRLRHAGGTILAVSDAVVADHRPVRSRAALRDPFADQPAAWARIVDDHGPALYRTARPDAPLRVAITTAAPSHKVAVRWGDWHFGNDLARAIERAGHEARVQTAAEADSTASRACDVHLVLHGLVDVARTRGQRHVLWVISHPETLTAEAVAAADLVFVASERFDPPGATATPVEVMLQATDQHRYTPAAADPREAHDVVVVAKTRTVMRPMVADALAAGLRPAIFGTGWEAFVDPALIVTPYLANDSVPAVYASAGVVLNDHWDTMREHGFVSNRIFDALACGAPVISDAMPDIPALFGDVVPMYRDAAELGALVRHDLADRAAARARAARGRTVVLANHTFDQRVSQLVAALVRHRLVAIA